MEETPKTTRYIIQDKHFAFNDKFVITDDSGIVVYKVDSTFFAIGDKLVLSDNNGNELIKIREESLHVHPVYKIISVRRDMDEMQMASIKRTGAPWNHKLEISTINGPYAINKRGGFFGNQYILTKDDVIVAIASKDPSPSTSVYWIDIATGREEDPAFLLALIIVLACVKRVPDNPLRTTRKESVEN